MLSLKDFMDNLIQQDLINTINIEDTDPLYPYMKDVLLFKTKNTDPYYICEYKELIELFQNSWGKEDIEKNDDLFFHLLLNFLYDNINFNVLSEIAQSWFLQGLYKEEHLVATYIASVKKTHKVIENQNLDYISFLHFSKQLGVKPIFYSLYEEIMKKLCNEFTPTIQEESLGSSLERSVKNLTERKGYIEEIVSVIPSEVVEYLDFFVSSEILNNYSYHRTKQFSEQLKIEEKVTLSVFQEKFEEILELNNFPSIPVKFDPHIKPHMKNVEALAVNITEFSHLSQDQIREYMTVKAYTCPEFSQKIKIIFLGGGGIGNMGIIVQHNNNAILLDYGMSVANYSIPCWHPSLNFVKTILVTHAHLDHTGALPYLIKPDDGRRWYGSPNTKILTEKLLYNTSAIIEESSKNMEELNPFFSSYLQKSSLVNLFNVFTPLRPKEPIEVSPGFEVTAYPSSHLYGSYGYEINVLGKRIFFTGDFSLNESALFPGANFPTDCDITIFDGTYYNKPTSTLDPNSVILQASELSERLLIPAFSVGRTQEIMARLEKLRISNKRDVKIIGMSGEITKAMGLKGNYHTSKMLHPEDFVENDIVIGGNGMLQSGGARKLLDATAQDSETGVLLCGYQAPNTLGFALRNDNPIATHTYHQHIFNAPISGHTQPLSLNKYIESLQGKKYMVHTPEGTKIKKDHNDVIIPKYLEKVEIKVK